jgi:hypothetical protein
VCLDCGREFAYDWQRMKIVSASATQKVAQSQVEIEAKAS